MFDAQYYLQKAEACRRLAQASKWSELYLLDLAESFESAAKAAELRLSGSKPQPKS